MKGAPGRKEQAKWHFEPDLVVVAAGAGGMTAAITASLEEALGAVDLDLKV